MTDNELDSFLAGVARELKEPVRLDARLDDRIMAALAPEVVSLDSRRVRPSLPWYRRTFAVPAPLGGLAAAAALAGIAAVGALAVRGPQDTRTGSEPVPALVQAANRPVDSSAQLQSVQFILPDANAKSVSLIGDFNDWDTSATPLVYDATHEAWVVTIQLPQGRHLYQFLVDGSKHVTDPTAPMASGDFGSPNSVVNVRLAQ